jgi:hypothetical protein
MDAKYTPPPAELPPQEAGKRAQDWTTEEKLSAVVETIALEGEALGVYLRRRGLHREQVAQWRDNARGALERPLSVKYSAEFSAMTASFLVGRASSFSTLVASIPRGSRHVGRWGPQIGSAG